MDAQRAAELTIRALDNFDNPGTKVSALVRQAQRIAVLREDYAAQIWLILETNDLSNRDKKDPIPDLLTTRAHLSIVIGNDAARKQDKVQFDRYCTNRRHGDKGEIMTLPVGVLESNLEQLRNTNNSFTLPNNMTPIDTYVMARDNSDSRATLLPALIMYEQVLTQIRQSVHAYLIQCEVQAVISKPSSDMFQRAQEYVNETLKEKSPATLEIFEAAQERISAGSSEDLAQALTSCRRMIKALADYLYPADNNSVTGIDGVPRKMSDDAYRNRLTEYVSAQMGKTKQKALIQSTITDLSTRLKHLDGLASKGVHDEVTASEAETCLVSTYMLAADLLRIADGSSILVQEEDDFTSGAGTIL